jgi:predicted SnoaL-like aldol condensation-catalyzing enzyme
MATSTTEFSSPTTPDDSPASLTDVAVRFLTIASAGRAREAWKRHAAPDFVHHNPGFSGDAESLIKAMDDNARANPDKVLAIQRTIAEGPLVAVHSWVRLGPDQPGASTVHIFLMEGGRIREMWDVAQTVPADSPNQHGMF